MAIYGIDYINEATYNDYGHEEPGDCLININGNYKTFSIGYQIGSSGDTTQDQIKAVKSFINNAEKAIERGKDRLIKYLKDEFDIKENIDNPFTYLRDGLITVTTSNDVILHFGSRLLPLDRRINLHFGKFGSLYKIEDQNYY